jgi:hypothetical protein
MPFAFAERPAAAALFWARHSRRNDDVRRRYSKIIRTAGNERVTNTIFTSRVRTHDRWDPLNLLAQWGPIAIRR